MMTEVIDYLKFHPMERDIILLELLRDDTISIARLVDLKESAMKSTIAKSKEEIANGYALLLRYRKGINKKTINDDTDKFLSDSSYSGLGKYTNMEE